MGEPFNNPFEKLKALSGKLAQDDSQNEQSKQDQIDENTAENATAPEASSVDDKDKAADSKEVQKKTEEKDTEKLTQELFPPELLDVLTAVLLKSSLSQERDNIIAADFEDLTKQCDINDERVKKYLEESDKKREAMIEGLDKYICDQGNLPKKLRNYQLNALIKIRDFIESGLFRGYVTHPTGAGKTILFSSLIKASGVKTLIVVPKKVLVKQTVEKLRHFLPESKISFVGSIDSKELNGLAEKGSQGDVVVVVEKSFKEKSDQLSQEDFDMVIWDEAHNSFSDVSQQTLRKYPSAIKLAFTATPDYIYSEEKPGYEEIVIDGVKMFRCSEKTMARYYPHEIDNISLKEALMQRMLAPLAYDRVNVDMDLSELKLKETAMGNDFVEKELIRLLEKNWPALRNATLGVFENGILGGENENPKSIMDKQIFAICATVKQAENLAEEFNKKYKDDPRFRDLENFAACISEKTSEKERNRILEAYEEKKIKLITSVQVLKEGWDSQVAEVCFMMRPTLSRVFYQQAIGRVLRLDENNPNKVGLIIDIVGKHKDMALMGAPSLFGIKEFYRGQILVPPDVEVENPYIPENPQLINVEDIDKMEVIDDGIVSYNGKLYMDANKLETEFFIHKDSVAYFKNRAPVLKSGRKKYYEINHYLDRDFWSKKIVESKRYKRDELSIITGLKEGYMRKFSDLVKTVESDVSYEYGRKELILQYDVSRALQTIRAELKRKIGEIASSKEGRIREKEIAERIETIRRIKELELIIEHIERDKDKDIGETLRRLNIKTNHAYNEALKEIIEYRLKNGKISLKLAFEKNTGIKPLIEQALKNK